MGIFDGVKDVHLENEHHKECDNGENAVAHEERVVANYNAAKAVRELAKARSYSCKGRVFFDGSLNDVASVPELTQHITKGVCTDSVEAVERRVSEARETRRLARTRDRGGTNPLVGCTL